VTLFKFGAKKWPGIAKLIEECGEVVQVCGKLIMIDGHIEHWSGDLKVMLEDELGDVLAAIQFVTKMCGLDGDKISRRAAQKLDLFYRWHENGPKESTA
jgi:NTP pyrophosphatase (non-canonical NTP hydrolase)